MPLRFTRVPQAIEVFGFSERREAHDLELVAVLRETRGTG